MPPAPPPISHPGVKRRDITNIFLSSAKSLQPGELCKDEYFTLFESVSALEVMDPKMDSGMLEEGETLDEDYDLARHLLPEEILGIIDRLLSHEMAWHLGHPLAQTLLTSVYLEALTNPSPKVKEEVGFTWKKSDSVQGQPLMFILEAYCAALLKTCGMVNEIMGEEMYYEEEDFVRNTCDRSLLYEISPEEVVGLLRDAMKRLQGFGDDIHDDIRNALDCRLEFRLRFFEAINLDRARDDRSELTRVPWIRLGELMEYIEIQHPLGKPVPEAFSTKLQRRLTSTMPPRNIIELQFDECCTHFKRFFKHGAEVLDVLDAENAPSLLNFFLTFPAQRPQPAVFIRTILQNLLFREMKVLGHWSIRELLDMDVSLAVLPCGPLFDRSFDDVELPSDPRHRIASLMESFRQRIAEPYLDMFRILCQNRCRVRRILCHHILEWDSLEAEVTMLEEKLMEPLKEISQSIIADQEMPYMPLSTWAYIYKLQQMEWIVQLGFELSIYHNDELAMMYFYLKRLAALRAQYVKRVQQATTEWEGRYRKIYRIGNDAPLSNKAALEFEHSRAYQFTSILGAAWTWEFADGLHLMYLALKRLGVLKPAPRPYGPEKLRYELRMKPFADLSFPTAQPFEEFTEDMEMGRMETLELLRLAEAAIVSARKGLEVSIRSEVCDLFCVNDAALARWTDNSKACLRATIAAGVQLSILKRAYHEAADEIASRLKEKGTAAEMQDLLKLKLEVPGPSNGYHSWWIVPQLTRLEEPRKT
ncbi:Mak10-domain-containing protein [Poronia punctata]|nr:Mak10-domain-containing protein [Poronia punctata]